MTSMRPAYGSSFSGRAASNYGATTEQGARLAGGNDYIVCMLGLCQAPASAQGSLDNRMLPYIPARGFPMIHKGELNKELQRQGGSACSL